jgi:hypothetical protein
MNEISPSFTIKQCEELIKYYSPLVIGKSVFKDVAIESLEIVTYDNSENTVICRGKRENPLHFRKDICSVALALNMTHPSEALKSLNL